MADGARVAGKGWRVLEDKSGDGGGRRALGGAMRARPTAAGGRGRPVCFEPKVAGKPGGLACAHTDTDAHTQTLTPTSTTSTCTHTLSPNPCRRPGQATSCNVGLSACGSLIADAPLGKRGPELCGRRG